MKNYNGTSQLSVQCVNNTAVPYHVHLTFNKTQVIIPILLNPGFKFREHKLWCRSSVSLCGWLPLLWNWTFQFRLKGMVKSYCAVLLTLCLQMYEIIWSPYNCQCKLHLHIQHIQNTANNTSCLNKQKVPCNNGLQNKTMWKTGANHRQLRCE